VTYTGAVGPVTFALVFGGTFLITGLVPIWLAMRTFAKDRAIARWPRAPGRVTVSRVDSHTSTSRDQDGYDRRYTLHDPVVHFTYTVGGQELHGDRLARVVVSSSEVPDLSRYAVGQEVQVFYDPSDPRTAYLEVRRSTGAVILTVFGGIFVAVGLLVPALVLFA